jgi:aspartyl-tRNA(Asn)/glutamyl-tRNA(Gln) amidotransferase subunit C
MFPHSPPSSCPGHCLSRFGSRRAKPGSAGSRLCFQVLSKLWEDCVMAISRDEVLHVAGLARLELTDEEVERFREQLNAILEAVGKVAELDLSDVEPTAHPLDLVNAWADDEPRPSLSVEQALANAPDRDGDLFRVPAG